MQCIQQATLYTHISIGKSELTAGCDPAVMKTHDWLRAPGKCSTEYILRSWGGIGMPSVLTGLSIKTVSLQHERNQWNLLWKCIHGAGICWMITCGQVGSLPLLSFESLKVRIGRWEPFEWGQRNSTHGNRAINDRFRHEYGQGDVDCCTSLWRFSWL